MKCIKAIKETKSYKLDEIRRTDDQDAEEKVKSGVWKFIPKSEWKANKKPVTVEKTSEEVAEKKEKKKNKK
jgi:hypothetical protein